MNYIDPLKEWLTPRVRQPPTFAAVVTFRNAQMMPDGNVYRHAWCDQWKRNDVIGKRELSELMVFDLDQNSIASFQCVEVTACCKCEAPPDTTECYRFKKSA